MNPFTLLVLVGLAALGAGVLAAFAYVIFFAILFVFVIAVMVVGAIGDHFYDKKMLRGETPYRLPWYFRWKGWQVGGSPDTYTYKTGMFYDRRVNRIIGMSRLIDRAFSERYSLGWRD